ncbi:hypothetical protein AVEN_87523-1, partial [Araneus ventricosus]
VEWVSELEPSSPEAQTLPLGHSDHLNNKREHFISPDGNDGDSDELKFIADPKCLISQCWQVNVGVTVSAYVI